MTDTENRRKKTDFLYYPNISAIWHHARKNKTKQKQEIQFGATLGPDVLIGFDEKILQDELDTGQC